MENPQNGKVIPIWQPQGYSTYQITKDVAARLGDKTTHTGVLDPMAEGVIIVLSGEKRFEKQKYSDGTKVYEFQVVFGISTDSYDGMGLIIKQNLSDIISRDKIQNLLPNYLGAYTQKVPLYSARKVSGIRLFDFPKRGLSTPELPEKKGRIISLDLIELGSHNLFDLVDTIISRITNIRLGQFRQEDIIGSWENFKKTITNKTILPYATIRVEMTRGLYVRSLSQDICSKLNTLGFVSNLVRTKNGEFTKLECCTLEEVC